MQGINIHNHMKESLFIDLLHDNFQHKDSFHVANPLRIGYNDKNKKLNFQFLFFILINILIIELATIQLLIIIN